MKFNQYQDLARKTADYPFIGFNYMYPAWGIVSEAGKIAGEIKKIVRDDGSIMTDNRKEAIILEMGDLLWHISSLASEIEVSLEEIVRRNVIKIKEKSI